MTACDAHFRVWWRVFLLRQAGVATFTDLIAAKVAWECSLALQRKLNPL